MDKQAKTAPPNFNEWKAKYTPPERQPENSGFFDALKKNRYALLILVATAAYIYLQYKRRKARRVQLAKAKEALKAANKFQQGTSLNAGPSKATTAPMPPLDPTADQKENTGGQTQAKPIPVAVSVAPPDPHFTLLKDIPSRSKESA